MVSGWTRVTRGRERLEPQGPDREQLGREPEGQCGDQVLGHGVRTLVETLISRSN